jgi:hypothetical protein
MTKPSQEILKRERLKAASGNLPAWAAMVSELVAERMRRLGSQIQIAQDILRNLEEVDVNVLREEIARCEREWLILEVLDDDLADPGLLLGFWRERTIIEALVTR